MTTMQSTATPFAPAAPERESVLGVIGISLGVLLIVLSVGALVVLGRPSPPVDGEALLRERFQRAGPFPFGLVIAGAERELDGREVVRLEGAPEAADDAGEEPPPADTDDAPADGAAAAPRIEWDSLPVVDDGEPARAALVWFPRKSAERVLRDQFTALRFESGRMGPGGGGGGGKTGAPPKAPEPKLQDGGTIAWAGYAAPYVRLREFQLEDGAPRFVESVRVNLTLGPHCCVLYLRWPHGVAGSREKTLEVLAALEPLAE